jgi:hypothetical protein
MNRPWLYVVRTIKHFRQRYTVDGLIKKMRNMHLPLVEREELAAKQGTVVHEVFQNDMVGNFTILAPSGARYIGLIPNLDKTPQRYSEADKSLGGILAAALKKARDFARTPPSLGI